MGLKTTNYEIKEIGMVLPKAYALLYEMRLCGNSGNAVFHVQTSPRANALSLNPLKRVVINFEWDRNRNPVEAAYAEAKAMKYKKQWDPAEKKYIDVEAPQPFYGWEDDIVENTAIETQKLD